MRSCVPQKDRNRFEKKRGSTWGHLGKPEINASLDGKKFIACITELKTQIDLKTMIQDNNMQKKNPYR